MREGGRERRLEGGRRRGRWREVMKHFEVVLGVSPKMAHSRIRLIRSTSVPVRIAVYARPVPGPVAPARASGIRYDSTDSSILEYRYYDEGWQHRLHQLYQFRQIAAHARPVPVRIAAYAKSVPVDSSIRYGRREGHLALDDALDQIYPPA
eukprot:228349-Rhodomonas_salina.1